MSTDTIDQLAAADPVAEPPEVPAVGQMYAKLEARRPQRPRPGRRPALLVLPLIAVVATVLVLSTGAGDRSPDVLAAVVSAIRPGTGVLYVDVTQSFPGRSETTRFQYWRTGTPRRERMLITESAPGRRTVTVERAIAAGATWRFWSSRVPRTIVGTDNTRHLALVFDASFVQAAYHHGELRLAGRTRAGGVAALRLEVVHPPAAGVPPTAFLVNAATFAPIELIDYRSKPGGGVEPAVVLRYAAYEELQPTTADVALTQMAPHPGAVVRPAPRP
jgi:hypothetical protein